jgi:hypothetical protein
MCTIEGCNSKMIARGLCAKHYARRRRTGDANQARKRGPKPSPWLDYLRTLFPNYSPRTRARFAEAMALLSPCGEEVRQRAITAASRPNGSLNVSHLVDLAALMRAEFERDHGGDVDDQRDRPDAGEE